MAAQWFTDIAHQKGKKCSLMNIDKVRGSVIVAPEKDTLLGFCSPTHGFNYPPIVLHFIARFPRSREKNCRVFLMNTRGGLKAGRFFLPGLSGLALWLPALILILKGYRIVGLRSVDLPSNWISLHPALREHTALSIKEHCKPLVEGFAEILLEGKRSLRSLRDIVQDLAISPISLVYYCIGRFLLAKSFYADSRCNQCGLCVAQCPVKAIAMVKKRPYWSVRCESCMRCMNSCPTKAIETGHGYFIALAYIAYAALIPWFWSLLNNFTPLTLLKSSWLLHFAVESVITFALMVAGYRIIHYVKQLAPVRVLIELTSLTSYSFWGRFKKLTKLH